MGEDGSVQQPTNTDGYYQGYPSQTGHQPAHTGISRRTWVILIAVTSVILGFGLMNVITVDKVVYSPGPVVDTLGANSEGTELISIQGLETYPTGGEISLTTVMVYGGPEQRVTAWDWMLAELNSQKTVVPREWVYPEQVTREEVTQRNDEAMRISQSGAEIVALQAAGVPQRMEVAAIAEDGPAEGVLEVGDLLVSVDGAPVEEGADAQAALQEVDPGDQVEVVVERDGEQVSASVAPELGEVQVGDGEVEERNLIGISMAPVFEGDFTIRFNAGNVGGPSAGMMFSLAIYDKLTPGELTGDIRFAGTGTMEVDGSVGGIGGVKQKMIAAEQDGYDYFLAPRSNCPDVLGNEPEGIEVVAVGTFDEALEVVESLGAGEDIDLPRC